ncbi:hypothetical protein E4T56_gene5829 [Termitomyces sp. T112]|nr:hypothetical protein E4T56_gene5829 [Termitomyces sp. T112]
MARYDKWWDMLTAQGIRLEDCTGALLGTLPNDEAEDVAEEEEDEDEDEDSEGDWEEEEEVESELIPSQEHGHGIEELRELLDQCRWMEKTREPSIFASMFRELEEKRLLLTSSLLPGSLI